MTHTLEAAFKEAEKLPASEQDKLAEIVLKQVKEIQDTVASAFTRLSENRLPLQQTRSTFFTSVASSTPWALL